MALCFSIPETKAAGVQVLLLPRLDLQPGDGETKTHLVKQIRILRPRERRGAVIVQSSTSETSTEEEDGEGSMHNRGESPGPHAP